ncbi:hypothetical protein SAMN00777080_1334 [Aquiflexum balticum DSM 16537]|uniref:Uncharacterized protein n=1 Tax=Aquiflexum balticum DSM 16537 TaxID=758820 RepID=A0A1W2H1J9_9BACT|nr:hypothetical protein [Aquiflexum balticum]SMD42769.1 hypothetical protein SAMN00777080_1334 [Aquiflexum balticum DSM 16537]
MKKLLIPFLAILFLASCEMESINDIQPEQEISSADLLSEGDAEDILNSQMRIGTSLEIAKTVLATYDRTVSWVVEKTVSQDKHMGAPGDEFLVNWTVEATKSENIGNYKVTGSISVTNPNDFSVPFTLSDVLNDGTGAIIVCPGTNDNTGTVPAGGSVSCDYSASPFDASATENEATVTSDVGGNSTTEGFAWSVNVIGDDAVTLSDPRVAYSKLISETTVEIFPETFTCPADQSLYIDGVYTETYTNTAYLDGANTDLEASAEVSIRCELPPSDGCALTQGYWKTHSEFGPAPYDDTWALLPSGASTTFYLSGSTWIQVFNTAPARNAYYQLAHHFMAAKLNVLNGASPSAVSSELSAAEALFNTYTPAQIAAESPNSPLRAQMLTLASTLDNYNNGIIGPGHCN